MYVTCKAKGVACIVFICLEDGAGVGVWMKGKWKIWMLLNQIEYEE